MGKILLLLIGAGVILTIQAKPLESVMSNEDEHRLTKRFINPSLTIGDFRGNLIEKIRAKRSYEDECEKLELCKLHARSSRNFLSAFELYFVNKENARLWDHRAHTTADCEQRYSCYR